MFAISIIRFQSSNNSCCILAHYLSRMSPNFHVVSDSIMQTNSTCSCSTNFQQLYILYTDYRMGFCFVLCKGHVIPEDHLLAIALTKGPSSVELDFTYQSRDCKKMVRLHSGIYSHMETCFAHSEIFGIFYNYSKWRLLYVCKTKQNTKNIIWNQERFSSRKYLAVIL